MFLDSAGMQVTHIPHLCTKGLIFVFISHGRCSWTMLVYISLRASWPYSTTSSMETSGIDLRINGVSHFFWWCDETFPNDVSPYEFSGIPSNLDESSQRHNVPALIHPCHFASTYMSQGTINLGTRGPRTFVVGHIVSGRPVTPPFFWCNI